MNRQFPSQPADMELEKQLDRAVVAIDAMDKAMVEFRQAIKVDIAEIKADVRTLKDGRMREIDIEAVRTDTRLANLERQLKEGFDEIKRQQITRREFDDMADELKWARRGIILALLTAVGSLIGMVAKH